MLFVCNFGAPIQKMASDDIVFKVRSIFTKNTSFCVPCEDKSLVVQQLWHLNLNKLELFHNVEHMSITVVFFFLQTCNSSSSLFWLLLDLLQCSSGHVCDVIYYLYPPLCKANSHWIRHGKHTPLYGRYHSTCHFLVCCVLYLFLSSDFCPSRYPSPNEEIHLVCLYLSFCDSPG